MIENNNEQCSEIEICVHVSIVQKVKGKHLSIDLVGAVFYFRFMRCFEFLYISVVFCSVFMY